MKESGHPLIAVIKYLFTHISTHSPTDVQTDVLIHSSASCGTFKVVNFIACLQLKLEFINIVCLYTS